jgi:nitrite reductase/ring-hydroxylating ferredoxin subunit
MERIFHRTWLFIGHESEVSEPGSFQLRRMGRQPVIMVRSTDGKVRVFMNRCRHRGTKVCEVENGRTNYFRCWYHGWVYDTTGKLVEVTGRDAYGPDFDQSALGLSSPPRVASYRGFVFASLSPTGIDLLGHLGCSAGVMDVAVDASPSGRLSVQSGAHKSAFRGNWKLVGMDGYHAPYVHASVYEAQRRKEGVGISATHRADDHDDLTSKARTRDLGSGHVMLDFGTVRLDRYDYYVGLVSKIPGGPAYLKAMEQSYGPDRSRRLIAFAGDPHLGIFPNLQLVGNQIRIINPIAADETELLNYPLTVDGMSEEMNTARLRQHESFYGPAGAGAPDDAEIFERVQQGLMADVDPWIDISRGMWRETVEPDGSIVGLLSDEVPQRAMMKRWRELMAEA